jgi:hypothetical protein
MPNCEFVLVCAIAGLPYCACTRAAPVPAATEPVVVITPAPIAVVVAPPEPTPG